MSTENFSFGSFVMGVLVGSVLSMMSAMLAREPSMTYENLVKYGHGEWKAEKGSGKPSFYLLTIRDKKVID